MENNNKNDVRAEVKRDIEARLTRVRKRRAEKRKRCLVLAAEYTAIALAVVVVLVFATGANAKYDEKKPSYEAVSATSYRVSAGDTLWSIAKGYCPEEMDIRDYIRIIMGANDLDTSKIYSGQKLIIPLYEEKTEQ